MNADRLPLVLFPRTDPGGRCVECGVFLHWCEQCGQYWAGCHRCPDAS